MDIKITMPVDQQLITREELLARVTEWESSFRRVRRRCHIAIGVILVVGMGFMFWWSTKDPPRFWFGIYPWFIIVLMFGAYILRERAVRKNDKVHAVFCPYCNRSLAGVIEIAIASCNCGNCGATIIQKGSSTRDKDPQST